MSKRTRRSFGAATLAAGVIAASSISPANAFIDHSTTNTVQDKYGSTDLTKEKLGKNAIYWTTYGVGVVLWTLTAMGLTFGAMAAAQQAGLVPTQEGV